MKRREFVQVSGLATAGLLVAGRGRAYAFSQSKPLQKFIQKLPLVFKDIPLATKNVSLYPGVDYYEIEMDQFRQQLHPDLPTQYGGTRLWGYASNGGTHKHLGGVIVASEGRPVRVKFINKLPDDNVLPVDITIPGAETGQALNRVAPHLHGGLVPWTSDGGPFHWFTPGEVETGASVIKWLPDNGGVHTTDYWYPNNQSARFMWYHDHAFGITRLNAAAGVATGYVLTDGFEAGLVGSDLIPDPTDLFGVASPGKTLYLVFQDKIFWDPAADPNYDYWVPNAVEGDLWYPYLYEPAIWGLQPGGTPPVPSVVAEFFGDTMLANGVVYPETTVEPTWYRFRMLNACNARFLNPRFVVENGTTGEPLMSGGKPVVAPVKFIEFGTEGGFLPGTVVYDFALAGTIPPLMGPAERTDMIVDFSAVPSGTNLILYTDAPAPFPGGSPLNDYYPGAKKNPTVSQPGFGPNTRTIMRVRVGTGAVAPYGKRASLLAQALKGWRSLAGYPNPATAVNAASPRGLTLNEDFDARGRLIQRVGTLVPLNPGTFARDYRDDPTEIVSYNTSEIWDIYNLTEDTHPMHFHLANVMVLSRQPFKMVGGAPSLTGSPIPPAPNEMGFKETVKMNGGEVTRVVAKFEDPLPGRTVTVTNASQQTFTGQLPTSPRLTGYDEYVWHCHILEHEEHDMMRPLVVIP